VSVEGVTYCARHPQVETALRCGRCDTLICPRCLVQTPVGARCPDCANVRRLPTVDIKPTFIARGAAAAVAAGIAVGGFWGYALEGGRGGFGLGFFLIFLALGIGWALSESVSAATNRKRGYVLQLTAVLGVILAYVVHNLVSGAGIFPTGDLRGYIATVIACVVAWQRLSP
jgi:hypothetical protein